MTATPDADLVVGADGIWSMTRRALDPDAPDPSYAGLYTVSGISAGLELEPGTFNMIFARNGAFIYLPAPDGAVWWSAQVAAPQPPDLPSIGADTLITLFESERQAGRILRAAETLHSATPNHILARVPRRYNETTVLIGDAAHPVGAGQGASMALEDAVVLAREISRTESILAALTSFDEVRGRRLDKMTATASANRDAKIAGPIASRLRNAFMPYFFPRFYEKATGWLYDYDPGTLPSPSDQILRG
jgi:2-polyprenyl-6-methoxyphenol hydroxylase-like FAD-dependent oxidoreductase